MQVFIIGATKSGKSTLARMIQEKGISIYEAGSWVREEFHAQHPEPHDEMSNDFKNALTQFAKNKLKDNNLYSFQKYQEKTQNIAGNLAIIGVRNPDDFIHMIEQSKDNRVIFLTNRFDFTGELADFETGIDVIKAYIQWKKAIMNIPTIEISLSDINSPEMQQKIKEFL